MSQTRAAVGTLGAQLGTPSSWNCTLGRVRLGLELGEEEPQVQDLSGQVWNLGQGQGPQFRKGGQKRRGWCKEKGPVQGERG